MFWMAEDLQQTQRGPTDDFWYGPVGRTTSSGVRVNPATSLALPAVYACVKVITDAVMQIPLLLYRRIGEDGRDKERETTDRRFVLLHDQPNELQSAAEWRETMQHHLLLRGNAYAKKRESSFGGIEALERPQHPDAVKSMFFRRVNGQLGIRYIFKPQLRDEVDEVLDQDQVLHVRGLSIDGLTGLSPIELEREAVGVGLSAQEFIGRYFQNDARPGGIIENPGNFKSVKSREKFRESFQSMQTGVNKHKTAILEYGMVYKPLELKLVDQQFLELRKYQNLDICRIFRVPPHLIMELDRATFSNIEHQGTEFVKYTLLSWLKKWEQRLAMSLLTNEERRTMFFEYLVDGLQRGDLKTRTLYYKEGINDGHLTRNEVRRLENRNSLEGLDEPLTPMNMRGVSEEPDDEEREEDEEERATELERNAAQALAHRQAQHLRRLRNGADSAETFLASARKYLEDVAAIRRGMVLPEAEAGQIATDSIQSLNGGDIADWEARQYTRLIEASSAL